MDGQLWTGTWESGTGLPQLEAYDDKTGKVLKRGDVILGTCSIGFGCTGPDIVPGTIWSLAQAEREFDMRYDLAQRDADKALGVAGQPLGDARSAILTDMAYEMGYNGLRGFSLMIAALRVGNWSAANKQCLSSKYAETDSPRRAKANAIILLTGEWIIPHPND